MTASLIFGLSCFIIFDLHGSCDGENPPLNGNSSLNEKTLKHQYQGLFLRSEREIRTLDTAGMNRVL